MYTYVCISLNRNIPKSNIDLIIIIFSDGNLKVYNVLFVIQKAIVLKLILNRLYIAIVFITTFILIYVPLLATWSHLKDDYTLEEHTTNSYSVCLRGC